MMQVDWLMLAGLAGVVLAITGSNVLVDLREWCKGFDHPYQPLLWIGIGLEFIGLVTDKSMAVAFLLGLVWWSGPLPWGEVLVLSGLLVIATALGDQLLAFLHGLTVKLMGASGGGPAPAPFPIPRGRGREGLPPPPDRMPREGTLPLTEDEAFDAMDRADEEADRDRGAVVGIGGGRR